MRIRIPTMEGRNPTPPHFRGKVFQIILLALFLAAALTTRIDLWPHLSAVADSGPGRLRWVDAVEAAVSLPEKVEADFNRQFSGRDTLVRAVYRFRLVILGERDFHDVVVGKDGWLFYTGEKNMDYYQRAGQLSDEQVKKLVTGLSEIRSTLADQGTAFYLIAAPNKESIYPDYLPNVIRRAESPSLFERMQSANKDPELILIDVRPALTAARENRRVYYLTDTHWNPEGAFIAYQVIMERIGEDFPGVLPHPADDFTRVEESISGDLSALLTMKGEWTEDSVEFEPVFTRSSLVEETGDDAVLKSKNTNPSLPRAMIFRDSFFNGLQPFLLEHFSEAVMVRSFELDMEWIAAENPDIVILEVAERYLPELITRQD